MKGLTQVFHNIPIEELPGFQYNLVVSGHKWNNVAVYNGNQYVRPLRQCLQNTQTRLTSHINIAEQKPQSCSNHRLTKTEFVRGRNNDAVASDSTLVPGDYRWAKDWTVLFQTVVYATDLTFVLYRLTILSVSLLSPPCSRILLTVQSLFANWGFIRRSIEVVVFRVVRYVEALMFVPNFFTDISSRKHDCFLFIFILQY